jgi:hypothetical protein
VSAIAWKFLIWVEYFFWERSWKWDFRGELEKFGFFEIWIRVEEKKEEKIRIRKSLLKDAI